MPLESVNPSTEVVVERFDELDADGIEHALSRSVAAAEEQRRLPVRDRAALMERAADILDRDADRLGRILTEEMGKTFAAAKAEVDKCAWACRYYAEQGPGFLANEPVEIDEGSAYVAHLPIGPVLAVMPWNFPLWQVFRFAAPALVAGNTTLLKHASNVPRAALAIQDVFNEAGFPRGAFQTLLVGSNAVEAILRDARIRGVTLTGSNAAGSAVGRTAGDVIKPSVLELGGSDAFIVMPSADLDAAVKAAVQGRILNNGQSCIAAKRFIVHADIYEAFRDRFVAAFEALTVGDPFAESTDLGPLALASIRDEICEQVDKSVAEGARRLVGAERIEGPNGGKGYWFQPGVIENIPEGSPAYCEEVFGPVALLFKAPSLDAAIDMANDNPFGLGSAIFTGERGDVDHAVRRLEAGATAVNRIVASDPRLPFGGVKESGYGRELARDGMMAFVNRKTVTISGF
jgi:succinate-semialdehyde dehydrogenase/glutarate-semialdehyde dehydrogenase